MSFRWKRVLIVPAMVLFTAGTVEAVPVTSFGNPVTSVTSSTGAVPNCPTLEGAVCYNPTTGNVAFFIPLSTSHAGVYGVTNVGGGHTAGTYSDTGGGTENADALTMFLRFSPVVVPAATASLRFNFVDLDLHGGSDPAGFFESVRFYDAAGNALTDRITMIGQPSGSLPFTVTGGTGTQTILFPNVTSIVHNPFYLDLRFRSSYTGTGTNTVESMVATLTSEGAAPPPPPPHQVPEPGTLGLLGVGLIVVAMAVRQPRVGRHARAKDRAA